MGRVSGKPASERALKESKMAKGYGSSFYRKLLLKELCAYCGKRPANSIDHIHPTAMGGPNHWMNFAPACSKCNNDKGHTSLLEFMLVGKKSRNYHRFSAETTLTDENKVIKDIFEQPGKWHDPLDIREGYRSRRNAV